MHGATIKILSPCFTRKYAASEQAIFSRIKYIVGTHTQNLPLSFHFAGSNQAEAVGFLRAKKSSAHLPSEGK